jgi:AraC-like DNA-binding protein/mannose-6-phosphate isomerase-like protein (cupin superfamily)
LFIKNCGFVMFTAFLNEARFQLAGHVRSDPAWRMQSHSHPFHELICVLRGRIHVMEGARTHAAVSGDVLFYPAGVPHAEWTDAEAPVESAYIAFACPLELETGIVILHDPRGRIAEMMRWLHEDVLAGCPATQPEQQSLLVAILSEWERGLSEPTHAWIKRFRQHVQAHVSEPLTLEILARVAGLSRYHFVRAYKQATGRTPMADVRAMRVQHARQLILGTALPLKEIAGLSGLRDAYALSRSFRHCLNTTPSELRRYHRA